MAETMEVDAAMYTTHPNTQDRSRDNQNVASGDHFVPGRHLHHFNHYRSHYPKVVAMASHSQSSAQVTVPHDKFREIQVKVHIRKPERDTWAYLGRGVVTQEVAGRSSRVGMFDSSQA
jgi:hypothetical protein